MAYVAAQLRLLEDDIAGDFKKWAYITATAVDKVAACFASGFFSDGWRRGMKIGNKVVIMEVDSVTTPTAVVAVKEAYVTTQGTKASPAATVKESNVGAATASAGAATLNSLMGQITTEALTTAAAAEYTLTLTNSQIAAADLIFASVDPLTSAGSPAIGQCKANAGSAVITVTNLHASAAFDAAIKINFMVIKA